MLKTYIVRTYDARTVHANDDCTVNATSPDEALTMVERTGLTYTDAEVCDADGRQVALYSDNDGLQTLLGW